MQAQYFVFGEQLISEGARLPKLEDYLNYTNA